MRRDVWYAFINEVNALHKFIQEFGPKDGDQSVYYVHGAHKGKAKAITCATNAIARLQALQQMRRLLDEPTKLVPFSFLQHAPYGDVVFQTLAVNFWAGPLNSKITDGDKQPGQHLISTQDASESSNHVFDIDGSVYLRKWMTSPSWFSNAAVAFWKHFSMRNGVVLSKNHVIAGVSLVEKAAIVCRDKYIIAEKTQATINAAMIEGIPSNIDLFKVGIAWPLSWSYLFSKSSLCFLYKLDISCYMKSKLSCIKMSSQITRLDSWRLIRFKFNSDMLCWGI